MRRALVTGAAGGIGAAIVSRLLADVDEVVALDVDAPGLERLRKQPDAGERVLGVSVDLADVEATVRAVQAAGAGDDGISVVVNAAGVISHAVFEELDVAEWDRIMTINLRAPFVISQAAVPLMRRGSCIVNITSIQAEVANADLAHYAASKGGLRQLTKAMAVALAPAGIRVVAVGPGGVKTALSRSWVQSQGGVDNVDHIPLARRAEPADIADVVAFAASDAARHMTGVTLYVDGGLLARA